MKLVKKSEDALRKMLRSEIRDRLWTNSHKTVREAEGNLLRFGNQCANIVLNNIFPDRDTTDPKERKYADEMLVVYEEAALVDIESDWSNRTKLSEVTHEYLQFVFANLLLAAFSEVLCKKPNAKFKDREYVFQIIFTGFKKEHYDLLVRTAATNPYFLYDALVDVYKSTDLIDSSFKA